MERLLERDVQVNGAGWRAQRGAPSLRTQLSRRSQVIIGYGEVGFEPGEAREQAHLVDGLIGIAAAEPLG